MENVTTRLAIAIKMSLVELLVLMEVYATEREHA